MSSGLSLEEQERLSKISAVSRPDRERYPFEKDWPGNVWSIGINRLDLLGVDDNGSLFWNGRQVEIKRRLSLSLWQRLGAVLLVAAAVVSAAAAAVSAYADMTAS